MIAARHYKAFWQRLNDPEAAASIPDWVHDCQARSRATRERILRAAEQRISADSFARTTMQDLASDANVSIGAAYARFPSKESVLSLLGLIVSDAVCRALESKLADIEEDAPLEDLMRAYIHTLLTQMRQHRSLIIELRRLAPTTPDLRAIMDQANARMHGAFLERAQRCHEDISIPDPDHALRFALFMASAAVREAVLANALRPYDLALGRDELVDMICQMVIAPLISR